MAKTFIGACVLALAASVRAAPALAAHQGDFRIRPRRECRRMRPLAARATRGGGGACAARRGSERPGVAARRTGCWHAATGTLCTGAKLRRRAAPRAGARRADAPSPGLVPPQANAQTFTNCNQATQQIQQVRFAAHAHARARPFAPARSLLPAAAAQWRHWLLLCARGAALRPRAGVRTLYRKRG